MAFVLCGRRDEAAAAAHARRMAGAAKLPYGGLNRIRFEGSVSTGRLAGRGTPASACI